MLNEGADYVPFVKSLTALDYSTRVNGDAVRNNESVVQWSGV